MIDQLSYIAYGIPVIPGKENTVPRRPDYVPPTYVYAEFAGERPRGRRIRGAITVIIIALALLVATAALAFAADPEPQEPPQPSMSPALTRPPQAPPTEGD